MHLCRRRWDICDSETLRYKLLNAYDRAMIHLEKVWGNELWEEEG